MRFSLCSVMLALCLVVWECTTNAETPGPGLEDKDAKTEGATTTTVAPNQVSLVKPVNQEEAGSEHVPKPQPDLTGQAGNQDLLERSPVLAPTRTSPIKADKQPDKVPETRTDDVPPNAQRGQSSLDAQNREQKSGTPIQKTGGSQRTDKADVKATKTTTGVEPGAQQEGSSPAEGKTTTTTAQVSTISGSQEDKVQGQSTQSKEGATPDLTVQDAAAAATTTTTNAPTITLPNHSKIPQSVNNKDSSSSTSLLLAFAMLATLAVIPMAVV